MLSGHESPLTINNELKQHHKSPGLCHKGSTNVQVKHFRNHAAHQDGAVPGSSCAPASAPPVTKGDPQVTSPVCGLGDATKPFVSQAASACPCSLAQAAAGLQQQGCCRENSLSVKLLGALRAVLPLQTLSRSSDLNHNQLLNLG